MADEKGVVGAEELEVLQWGASVGLQSRGGDDEGDVVARVGVHDLVGADGPINPLDLVVSGMVNEHRGRLRRLTVPHDMIILWARFGQIIWMEEGEEAS